MPCLCMTLQGIFLILIYYWYNKIMDIDYNEKDWATPCPKYDCRKTACKCGLEYVNIPASLGDDSEGSKVAPKNGAYCNALVVYEGNGHVYIYSKEGVPTLIDADASDISTLEQEVRKAQRDVHELENDIEGINLDILRVSSESVHGADTVNDMKSDTNLVAGDKVRTLGFYQKGDGGGAYYSIGTTGTPNNMNIISLNNGLIATYVTEDKVVTPQQFGALADGNMDCTAIIQAAVNSGNKVYFPYGTYKVTDSIILDRYSHIEMQGDGGLVGAVTNKVATIVSYTDEPAFRIIGECVIIRGGIIKARVTTPKGLVMVDLSDELSRTTDQMNDIEIDTSIYKWRYYAGGINDGSVGLCIYYGNTSSDNSGTGLRVSGEIRDFDYGIKSHKDIETNAWFTGMWHDGFIVNCCRAISLENSLGGSYFYGQYQSLNDANMPEWAYQYGCIYLKNTRYVLINGYVWDWGRAQNSNRFPVYCAGVCNQVIYTRSGDVGYESKSYRRDAINKYTYEKDFPYGAWPSNNESDLLAFANLKYAVNVIAPISDIATEQSPNYWLNALDRSAIKDYALFKPAEGVVDPDSVEYGYEIYFDKGHQIGQIGFQLSNYLHSPNSVDIYVYYNNEWKLNTTIKCKYDADDPQSVHNITALGFGLVYFERGRNFFDPWRNEETEIYGIKLVFKGFSNVSEGAKIRAVWAREFIPSSASGEKLSINGGKTYGRYVFQENPVVVDSTTGDCYTLGVDNGTITATKITGNDPKKFVLSTRTISMSADSTATFTVRLTDLPVGDCPVAFSSNNAQVTVTSSVLFNAGNWDAEQTVTITASASASGTATITANTPSSYDVQTITVTIV